MPSDTIVAVTLPATPAVVVSIPTVIVWPAFCAIVHKFAVPTILNTVPTAAAAGRINCTGVAPLTMYAVLSVNVIGFNAEVTITQV